MVKILRHKVAVIDRKHLLFIVVFIAWVLGGVVPATAAGLLHRLIGYKEEPKLVLVFMDVSVSIPQEDWTIYESTYNAVINKLQPGDRVVLGLIANKPLTRLIAEKDSELPMTGVELDDNDEAEKIRAGLFNKFKEIKRMAEEGRIKKTVTRSYILDTLNMAQQYIEGDRKRKRAWVIILSDMIEDSDGYRFDKRQLNPATIREMIDSIKERKMLPNLHGALVYVVGAGGVDKNKYQEISEFWMQYFKETSAVCEQYGRTVPQFP